MLAASLIADLARVALGLALVVAAITKIAAGGRWVDQAAALGVGQGIAAVLPWLELVIGAAVAAGVVEPWPAAIAVGLLTIFTAWIAIHLVRGEHPPCACFGAFSAAPLSWWHVARNVALIAIGVVAAIP